MPTYEYLCRNCGERFEKVQSFTARPLKRHDACGGEVQKVFHASGVVFKGSGFYATDSRAVKGSTNGDSGTSTPADTKPSDTKSSDTRSSNTNGKAAKKDAAPASAAAD